MGAFCGIYSLTETSSRIGPLGSLIKTAGTSRCSTLLDERWFGIRAALVNAFTCLKAGDVDDASKNNDLISAIV